MEWLGFFRSGAVLFSVLVISLVLHEVAHSWVAYRMGDPTANELGRVTLNPLKHLDPVGGALLLLLAFGGVGLGWAKPVPLRPERTTHPKLTLFVASIAGPLSNLLLAVVVWGIFIYFSSQPAMMQVPPALRVLIGELALSFLYVNCALALFNLLPLYPLDGFRIWSALFPQQTREKFETVLQRWGMLPLLLVLLLEWTTPIRPFRTLFITTIRAVAMGIDQLLH